MQIISGGYRIGTMESSTNFKVCLGGASAELRNAYLYEDSWRNFSLEEKNLYVLFIKVFILSFNHDY